MAVASVKLEVCTLPLLAYMQGWVGNKDDS